MNHSIQIPNHDNEVVSTFLNILLADEYLLYTKTRTVIWNIDGAQSNELRVFLENLRDELGIMIDEIAEQIRSHSHFAIGSLKYFLSIAQLDDDNQDFRNSGNILEILKNDHYSIFNLIQHEINPISNHFNDQATADFLSGIMEQHKKVVWMLQMYISNPEIITTSQKHIINEQSVIYRDLDLKKNGIRKPVNQGEHLKFCK